MILGFLALMILLDGAVDDVKSASLVLPEQV
jgi:hypothetical protein